MNSAFVDNSSINRNHKAGQTRFTRGGEPVIRPEPEYIIQINTLLNVIFFVGIIALKIFQFFYLRVKNNS